MSDLTLEQIAKRLVALEDKVAALADKRTKDWRRTVGMFEGSEFMAQVDAEVLAAREAERQAARAGTCE
jgi:hypothetical protein